MIVLEQTHQSYRCLENNENPNCMNEKSHGCVDCDIGYFKPYWDTSCLLCSNIDGCIRCLSGYVPMWSNECDFNICVPF